MNLNGCITRQIIAPDSDLDGLWPSILVPPDIKARLINHTILALRLRSELPFEVTALHGLVLLYGPPGTGKTTLARGLANEVAPALGEVRLIEVNPHGLMSSEHGQSQQRVAALLGDVIPGIAADGIPTIVVIDEVESMAVARSEASLGANPVDVHRATDAVLTALDHAATAHPHIVWVATSNFTDALDEAFRSRADAAIEVPLPGARGVEEILRDTLRRFGKKYSNLKALADDPALAEIADRIPDLDGRRARKVVVEALASRRETAVDPNVLRLEDLRLAAGSAMGAS